jgi:hypothetical protein
VSNYPNSWEQYCTLVRDSEVELPIEFSDNLGGLSRWSARFRLAKSFRSLDLGDEYSGSETPRLYSSITRIFLVYSAFETYCKILKLDLDQVKKMQDNYSQKSIIQRIRDLDQEHKLPKFLMPHLNPGLKTKIQEFIDGEEVSVSFLARCIRHIFAHGILAAYSNFLLNCMDSDFDERVEMIANKSSR